MNNIAEGFGRKSDKEFARFLDIALSSAMEVKSIAYVLDDLRYLTKEKIQMIQSEAEKTKSLTIGLKLYITRKPGGSLQQVNTSTRQNVTQ